jgi:hypothetical protein
MCHVNKFLIQFNNWSVLVSVHPNPLEQAWADKAILYCSGVFYASNGQLRQCFNEGNKCLSSFQNQLGFVMPISSRKFFITRPLLAYPKAYINIFKKVLSTLLFFSNVRSEFCETFNLKK